MQKFVLDGALSSKKEEHHVVRLLVAYTHWGASLHPRDVYTVHLAEQHDQDGDQPTAADAEAAERFICPVTHLHSTRYPFVALSTCGHVFSDRAVKQVCCSALFELQDLSIDRCLLVSAAQCCEL